MREFLERDVMAATEGRVQFHTRVAVNVLGIVERELDARARARRRRERAPRRRAARPRRRRPTTSSASSPPAIRAGALDDRLDAVRAHVRATVREKLLDREPRLPARPIRPPSLAARMRIATWNVNSLKARLPRVEEFLGYADVDVLCLQETKLTDKAFPALTFSGARLRVGAQRPGPVERRRDPVARRHRRTSPTASTTRTSIPTRATRASSRPTCGGIRRRQRVRAERPRGRHRLLRPQARSGSQTLHDWLAATHTPADPLVVLGDFNVAPEDRDVWDPKKFVGATHVTRARTRGRRRGSRSGAWKTLFRRVYPDADRLYSYWDYRAGDFHQHRGMRIDLVLATAPGRRPGHVGRRRPQRPQGHRPVRPRARDHRPRRLDRRQPRSDQVAVRELERAARERGNAALERRRSTRRRSCPRGSARTNLPSRTRA